MNPKQNIALEIKCMDNMINRHIINKAKNLKMKFTLTPVQFRILHYLFKNKEKIIYQNDIEKLIESRRSTTSGILNTMEKNNLIKRVDSKKDARKKRIVLTSSCKGYYNKMLKQRQLFEEKLKENISNEELEIFFKVTEKIKSNIMNM